jgi:Ca-activated chloride channel homolog
MRFSLPEQVRSVIPFLAASIVFACMVHRANAQNVPSSASIAQSPSPDTAPSTTSQPPQSQQAAEPQQEPPASDQGGFVFKKEVEEVILHATVVDEHNHLVTNLGQNAFSVFEDDAPQPITSFRQEDVPVAMGILIDNSGSMRDKRASVNEAVLNLIRTSNPDDQIFVVNFGTDSYLDQDFTSDVTLLQKALQSVSMRGSTALYDAVVASSVHLERSARLDKKVLLVITDGQDNASQETLQEATYRLQREKKGPTLYAIGILGNDGRLLGYGALQSLAGSTGGIAFFPQTLDELNDITRAVAHDVRSQYTIGYKPGNTGNGYRTIRVEAHARGYRKLSVRTRTGYWPGEPVN